MSVRKLQKRTIKQVEKTHIRYEFIFLNIIVGQSLFLLLLDSLLFHLFYLLFLSSARPSRDVLYLSELFSFIEAYCFR